MASDITLAVGDGARRMTYAELAAVRRIIRALESANAALRETITRRRFAICDSASTPQPQSDVKSASLKLRNAAGCWRC